VDVGVLIERLAGQILHLLADVAADDVADGVADRADAGADRAGLACRAPRIGRTAAW
jgi:hypothetical protein